MAESRWLADEMVGKLARYLRFVGCDTAYVRGLSDDEVLARALAEDRVLLTRDRALARRASRAVLLDSPQVEAQWKSVRTAFPELPTEVRFDRCTECNGCLVPYSVGSEPRRESGIPPEILGGSRTIFRCASCGHLYWEGSHTRQIRARIAAWAGRPPP